MPELGKVGDTLSEELRVKMPGINQHLIKVAIIGLGHVGATFAYALQLRGTASEIVLINIHRKRAEGEAMDLNHGMLFGHPTRIWAGDYSDCAGADIVVLTAGVGQHPDETRMDLLKGNAGVFQEIIPQIVKHVQDAILIVVTNPVDVMTYVAWKLSGFPASHVIGSGTILDTARFRYLLSQHFDVEPRSVHAFIIGEHGDSQVAVWSSANIAGIRLDDYRQSNGGNMDDRLKAEITDNTRRAAYEVIHRKGATYYAIAIGLVRIIEAITRNEKCVLTVSSLVQGAYDLNDVCLSLPSVVCRQGVAHMLEIPLELEERIALDKSAQTIRSAIEELGY